MLTAKKERKNSLWFTHDAYPSCCGAEIIHGFTPYQITDVLVAGRNVRSRLEDTSVPSFHAITNSEHQALVEAVLRAAGFTLTASFPNFGGTSLNVWFFQNTNAHNNVEDDDDY